MDRDDHIGDESLADFVEGHGSEALRARIEEHASRCEACRQVLSALARSTLPATPHARPAAMPVRVGRYEIVRELGAGGMGVVYAARDPELDRVVAVKLLHDDVEGMQDRLRGEAKAMAQLAHPNVVTVFDVGAYEGHVFVAMEYIDGETLTRWLRDRHSVHAIVEAFDAAGRGLAAAHAAGIVHRDFKPDNVLIGRDGRVRVADFGLARTSRGTPDLASPERPSTLTRTGAIVGTPYFMAPELYDGDAATPQSDQFAFCVALFVALHDELPFEGATFEALAVNIGEGRVRAPARPRGTRRMRHAILRGLAVDPAARFPTMAALLRELAPPRRSRIALAAAGVMSVGVIGALALRGSAQPPCPRVATSWDAPHRVAVVAGLLGSGAPYAPTSEREVLRLLDGYANEWEAMQLDACVATNVRDVQSPAVLANRSACLDTRRRALAATIDAFATGGPATVERAVAAVAALPPIADCAEGDAPEIAGIASELRGRLAELAVARETGRAETAVAPARAVLAEARALGLRDVETLAWLAIGRLDAELGHTDQAIAADAEAVRLAHGDRLIARALVDELARYYDLEQHAAVAPLHDRAVATLDRLGRPAALTAELAFVMGGIEYDDGELVDAQRDFDAAIALDEKLDGADSIQLVEPLRSRGAVFVRRSMPDQARADLERALAIQRRALGDAHPAIVQTIDQLAGATVEARDYASAVRLYRDAEVRYARQVGPSSMLVANALSNEAYALVWQDKLDDGLARQRQAIAIATQQLGADAPRTLTFRERIGSELEDAGRHAEALAALEPVLAKLRPLGPSKDLATSLQAVAHAELWSGHPAPARDHAQEAYDLLTRLFGTSYRPYDELLLIGAAEVAMNEPASAIGTLEHALTDAANADPSSVAYCKGLLGRALYDSHRDRTRGLSLIREAWIVIAADSRGPRERAELASWASAHQITL